MKRLLKVSAHLVLCFFGLYVLSLIFEFSARLWSGVELSDLDFHTYASSVPDPKDNFFSSLDFDFKNPREGRYLSASLSSSFRPGATGNPPSQSESIILWPVDPVFSHTFDITATARYLKECASKIPDSSSADLLSLRQKISNATDPSQICRLSTNYYRPFLDNIYASLEKPITLNPTPYPETISLDMPTISITDVIFICRLLTLDGYLLTKSEKNVFPVRSILSNLRIAEGLLERPSGRISYFLSLICIDITLPLIWEGLENSHFNETDTCMLLNAIERLDVMNSFHKAILMERSFEYRFLSVYFDKEKGFLSILAKPVALKMLQGLFVLPIKEINHRIASNSVFKSDLPLKKSFFSILELFYPRSLLKDYNYARKQDIMLSMTRLDIALSLFTQKKGFSPDTLVELVPSILPTLPVDPFTGKDFLYRKTGSNTYLLYSAWTNEKDDGGVSFVIPEPKPKDLDNFLFYEAKGDFVWPQHHSGRN